VIGRCGFAYLVVDHRADVAFGEGNFEPWRELAFGYREFGDGCEDVVGTAFET